MTVEKRTWTIARLTAILLVLVSLRIIYWQMIRGDELQPVAINLAHAAGQYEAIQVDQPEGLHNSVAFLTGIRTVKDLESLPRPVIQRTMNLLNTIQRGTIFDRNGRVLATDFPFPDGEVIRFYTEPSLAHTIGYVSGLRTGVTGLELSYNTTLLGLNRPEAQIEQMLNKPIFGSDLILTIDSYIQRAAEQALAGRPGTILVLDAKDGAVLALASAPRFDPNRILDESYVNGLMVPCQEVSGCPAPFLNRATQGLYPPGSTWKTITLIAALDSRQVTPETVFDFGEPIQGEDGPYYVYQVDGSTIIDPNHTENRLVLEMAYAKSANAAFARMGHEMHPDMLINYAGRFGFGSTDNGFLNPSEIEFFPSQIARDTSSLYNNNWLRAVTAIGQGELLASPMNIGMVVLSVLKDGDLPVPYFVQKIRQPDGREIDDLPNRRALVNRMQPATAQLVRQMMVRVVEEGSGIPAQISGATVGGKTGTAQVGDSRQPHAWFAGFAQNENRGVVVVVLIENSGEGSKIAAPIFADVAETALFHMGEPVREFVPTPVQTLPTAISPPLPTEELPEITLPVDLTVTAPAVEIPVETSTPTPKAEPAEIPTAAQPTPTSQAAATPTILATPTPTGVLPPDILRDPNKNDITATNPSCANLRDMPQATGTFIWPSHYQALSGGHFREGHPGFDLSAPLGSPVYAADTGLVIFAGWSGLGYGNTVLIDHGNGYQTLYAHLSQVSIYCGAKVEKGQLVALSGDTGNSTGPHLHFEIRVPGGYLDPLKVLPVP